MLIVNNTIIMQQLFLNTQYTWDRNAQGLEIYPQPAKERQNLTSSMSLKLPYNSPILVIAEKKIEGSTLFFIRFTC